MKERPILFSAPMVRAILEGTKLQTRRVMKPQPTGEISNIGTLQAKGHPKDGSYGASFHDALEMAHWHSCPYGQPGDRLWVRETWNAHETARDIQADDCLVDYRIEYKADGACREFSLDAKKVDFAVGGDFETYSKICDKSKIGRFRPSIHMPRWASRINLEVTGVRVERLQDISEADAYQEGVKRTSYWQKDYVAAYADLWNVIHKGGAEWHANPWVWVIEFKRVTP